MEKVNRQLDNLRRLIVVAEKIEKRIGIEDSEMSIVMDVFIYELAQERVLCDDSVLLEIINDYPLIETIIGKDFNSFKDLCKIYISCPSFFDIMLQGELAEVFKRVNDCIGKTYDMDEISGGSPNQFIRNIAEMAGVGLNASIKLMYTAFSKIKEKVKTKINTGSTALDFILLTSITLVIVSALYYIIIPLLKIIPKVVPSVYQLMRKEMTPPMDIGLLQYGKDKLYIPRKNSHVTLLDLLLSLGYDKTGSASQMQIINNVLARVNTPGSYNSAMPLAIVNTACSIARQSINIHPAVLNTISLYTEDDAGSLNVLNFVETITEQQVSAISFITHKLAPVLETIRINWDLVKRLVSNKRQRYIELAIYTAGVVNNSLDYPLENVSPFVRPLVINLNNLLIGVRSISDAEFNESSQVSIEGGRKMYKKKTKMKRSKTSTRRKISRRINLNARLKR